MARKQRSKGSTMTTDADEVAGSVDKIRDIIFGGQMRDYDARFAELEKSLSQSIERLNRDLEKRVERLDVFTRREVEKLAEQVKAEKKDRASDNKKGAGELQHLAHQMESWIAEVDEQVAAEAEDLRGSIDEQNKALSNLIREASDELNNTIASESQNLADSKVGREDLAAMLTALAKQLKSG